MKKNVFRNIALLTAVVAIAVSAVMTFVECLCHSTASQLGIIWLSAIGAVIIGIYLLINEARIMAGRMDTENKKANGNPEHRISPMFKFLLYAVLEIALAVGCVYLATKIGRARDILNYELFVMVSLYTLYFVAIWSKAPAKKEEKK